MRETSAPGGTERSAILEGAANREQVMQAFNSAAFSWSNKTSRLHKGIDASREIDDLSDTGLLTEAQRKQLADFRTFQKGVRGLSGGDFLILHDAQRKDALTTTFRDSDSGEVYQREEGLDVSGLIASAREDVEATRVRLAEQRASRYSSPVGISHLESTLNQQESQLHILEENSVPYVEAVPNALDENNPQERARIAEEARRIWKFPLTNTGSDEGNWQAAKARLAEARLLQVPPKEEGLKVVPLTVDTSTRVLGDSEPLPAPVAAKPGVVHEMGHAMYGIPHSRVGEDHPVGADAPTPTIHDPNFVPAPFRESVAAEETGDAPEVPKTGEVIPPPANGSRRSPGSPSVTIDGQFSELGGPGYASRFGVFIRDLIDAGAQGADALVNRIREVRRRWGERESRVDPATARKVDTLMRIKPTDAQRGKCRLAALPLVLLLLAGIPRDTIGAVSSNGKDNTPPIAAGDSGLKPPIEPLKPIREEEPKTLEEFVNGKGLKDTFTRITRNDFTLRGDYQEKIQPNNPNANVQDIEGYSVRGMTQSDLAKVMNPDLAQEADQLALEGKATFEGDPKLLRTLELMEQEIDSYYGPGTYDSMIRDFSGRMGRSVAMFNEGAEPRFGSSILDDKIIEGKILKWQIMDKDMDTWFGLKTAGTNLHPQEWQYIRERVTQQVREETKQQ